MSLLYPTDNKLDVRRNKVTPQGMVSEPMIVLPLYLIQQDSY